MAKARKKAPSRVRYEQGHPTISCRITRELYDSLRKAKSTGGRSFADILKVGLGVLEANTRKEAELIKQGYASGYKKGYAEAESAFKVTYPCSVCGRQLTVTSQDEKEAIRGYMQEHSWGHRECHERGR
jgi:predicted CopG family antitoxin